MNSLRLVAMILIGDAGAPDIATGGFHNNGGWVTVLIVALIFLAAASRLPGIYRPQPTHAHSGRSTNDIIAPYFMPFVAILAAGVLAGSMSNGFEWAYALRVAAAGAVLWSFRRHYREIDFRTGWTGPLIGVAVFVIWIAADSLIGSVPVGMPGSLTGSSGPFRFAWIVFRIAGAVVTVPIAEELAFRGVLIRRFASPPPGSAIFEQAPWVALAISSLIFGLLHGGPWLAATAAGVLYGLAAFRKGRLGESIAAHATTNALLAGYVLIFNRWNFW